LSSSAFGFIDQRKGVEKKIERTNDMAVGPPRTLPQAVIGGRAGMAWNTLLKAVKP